MCTISCIILLAQTTVQFHVSSYMHRPQTHNSYYTVKYEIPEQPFKAVWLFLPSCSLIVAGQPWVFWISLHHGEWRLSVCQLWVGTTGLNWVFLAQGWWGLLSLFCLFCYSPLLLSLSRNWLPMEYYVYIWQVSPQLSCGDTWQIWTWFKLNNVYFCKIKIFSNG